MKPTPKLRLAISLLLIALSIILPSYLKLGDSNIFVLVFTTLLSMFLLQKTKMRKWYFILGPVVCVLAILLYLLLLGRPDLMEFQRIGRAFFHYFVFLAPTATVGYILTDGLKMKLNMAIKLGVFNFLIICLLSPLFRSHIDSTFAIPILFSVFGFFNGFFSERKKLIQNFLYFLTPLFLMLIIYVIIDASGFNLRFAKTLSIWIGLTIGAMALGFFIRKFRKNKIKTEKHEA